MDNRHRQWGAELARELWAQTPDLKRVPHDPPRELSPDREAPEWHEFRGGYRDELHTLNLQAELEAKRLQSGAA